MMAVGNMKAGRAGVTAGGAKAGRAATGRTGGWR
jgi:hypothetical protein